MRKLSLVLFYGIGPLLALVLGSLGVELALTEDSPGANFTGWLLLLAGVSYPVGAVIYYQRRARPAGSGQ